MSNEENKNELNQEPTPIQKKVNSSPSRGITIDFAGWFIRLGDKVKKWQLKENDYEKIKTVRLRKRQHEDMILALKAGTLWPHKTLTDASGKPIKVPITDSDIEEDSDELTYLIHEAALDGFDRKTWDEIMAHPRGGRGTLARNGEDLYIFLMEITTLQEARRLIKPIEGAPSFFDTKQD